jgi:hypothetical protein
MITRVHAYANIANDYMPVDRSNHSLSYMLSNQTCTLCIYKYTYAHGIIL